MRGSDFPVSRKRSFLIRLPEAPFRRNFMYQILSFFLKGWGDIETQGNSTSIADVRRRPGTVCKLHVTNSNEALPQTDDACGDCGSDRRFMTSFGRTKLRWDR